LNDRWYIGEGDLTYYKNGNLGQWGLKFASEIVRNQKVPVAIFNGARGARPISYFDKNYTEQGQEMNNYERLLYRLEKTELISSVRSVFWSQGESDENTSIADYFNSFSNIKKSWQSDFTSLEKIYLFQTKSACGSGDLMNVKEAQRQVATFDKTIDIIQTSALKYAPPLASNIDCHFSFEGGYEEFGNRLYQLVRRDIYDLNLETRALVETPLLKDAYLSNDKTIIIETDADNLVMTNPVENFKLENAGNVSIQNVTVENNLIILTLSDFPGINVGISHLGFSKSLTNPNTFVTNENNIELVSFYNFPVKSSRLTVWENNTWSNGLPNAEVNAVINDLYVATNGNLIARDLTVNSELNFNKNTGNSVVVHRDLMINESFVIGDKESLVMTNDNGQVVGDITKIERSFTRNDKKELSYWSSSVKDADLEKKIS